MYCIMILSTMCIVLLEFSKPFTAVLIVFYLSAGFFAVFFTSEFMELSWYVRIPELWAGMGRAVNNITAAVIAGFVLQLLSSDNNLLKIILILVLFVLVSIISVVYTFEKYYFIQQFTMRTDEAANEHDKLQILAEKYSFTEREKKYLTTWLLLKIISRLFQSICTYQGVPLNDIFQLFMKKPVLNHELDLLIFITNNSFNIYMSLYHLFFSFRAAWRNSATLF